MRLGTGLATAKLGGTTVASIRRGANTVYDADATTYLKAVEAADGQGLEPAVAKAIQDFVVGLKATSAGIAADPTRTLWDAVQASCIMCGARTISGALVPLKGTAPTPSNLVNFDYTRTGGIEGDGSSTYLDSNRTENADGQNDAHMSVFVTAAAGSGQVNFIGSQFSWIAEDDVATYFRLNQSSSASVASHANTGFLGVSRDDAADMDYRVSGVTDSLSQVSVAPSAGSVTVYRNYLGAQYNDARLAFYSIGSAIPDLAALDTKVTALVAAVSAALA